PWLARRRAGARARGPARHRQRAALVAAPPPFAPALERGDRRARPPRSAQPVPRPAPAEGEQAMTARGGADISVCLLTYDHVALVESTLDSVLAQNIGGFELIVSDDGSTDGTWELISRRAAADPRITAIRTPRNLGMPGNANFAARRSSRPYL